MATSDLARLLAGIGALAVGLTAVALAVLLLHDTPGPVSAGAAAPVAGPVPEPDRFPAPPDGAVVFAHEDGDDAVALAVVPGANGVGVQASVVGGQGRGVDALPVSFDATPAVPCGAGCYSATLPAPRPRSILLRVASTAWRVPLPTPWPPPAADRLVDKAAQVWRSLHSLVFFDRLASDPTHAVVSTWRAVAPDRLAYRVRGGYDAVIIGSTRWDKAPGGGWVKSPQSAPLRQPVPLWQTSTDAHVIASTPSTWRITFFDPKTPAWFEIVVDRRTLHTLELHMTTTAHFMYERYGPFDAPIRVVPPNRSG